MDTLDIIKIKNFVFHRSVSEKLEGKSQKWETIFSNYIFDKG